MGWPIGSPQTRNSCRSAGSTTGWRHSTTGRSWLALHFDNSEWDGLITTDAKMLSLPRELAVLCQTKLTLVVAEAVGHDPIKATGLVLAHITRICEQTRPDTAQVWRLRTSTKPAEDPWIFLERVAERRDTDAQALYSSERLTKAKLRRSPLD